MHVLYVLNRTKSPRRLVLASSLATESLGLGMAMGWGGAEGWGLRPCPAWIFLAPSSPRLAPHDGENFLPPPHPLRPPRSPAPTRKTLFLVNFPYNYYIFSNKMTCFNNKNILEPNQCYKLLSSVHYFFLTSKIELYCMKGRKPKKLQKVRIVADSSPPKNKIK